MLSLEKSIYFTLYVERKCVRFLFGVLSLRTFFKALIRYVFEVLIFRPT